MGVLRTIYNKMKRLTLPKVKKFEKNGKWMLDESDMRPIWDNIIRCKEFRAMVGCEHSSRYHKEGDPLDHTELVTKRMREFFVSQYVRDKGDGVYEFENFGAKFEFEKWQARLLMLAAICHDIGKPPTTYYDKEEKDWRCRNHGAAGEKITRNLLFDEVIEMRERVCWLVRNHMIFHHFFEKTEEKQRELLIKLSKGPATIMELVILYICDSLGSDSNENEYEKYFVIYRNVNKIYKMCTELNIWDHCYIEENTERDGNVAVFMIGVPGCGKTTLAEKINKDEGFEIICRDTIREEVKDGNVSGRKLLLDKDGEAKVTREVNKRIKKCCQENRSFIIDQTNMTRKGRKKMLDLIHTYGNPMIEYRYVEGPSLNECIMRRGGGKWREIVHNMWDNFDFPDHNECDILLIFKNS